MVLMRKRRKSLTRERTSFMSRVVLRSRASASFGKRQGPQVRYTRVERYGGRWKQETGIKYTEDNLVAADHRAGDRRRREDEADLVVLQEPREPERAAAR
jgi:hypothetical protein